MRQFTPAFLTSMGLALMAMALVACVDDDCDLPLNSGLEEADPAPGYRDPGTGQCIPIGGTNPGGPDHCGDFEPRPAGDQAPQAEPDMALCFAGCEGLTEIECVTDPACRSIYQGDEFVDCWGVAPSGPAPGTPCENLDAYSCSRTNHCAAVHDGGGNFLSCENEKRACTDDSECGGSGTCSATEECLAGPGCTGDVDCDLSCWGFCDEPQTDPGSCVGEVSCDLPEPNCPEGTIAGRDETCWTGWCIPIEACDATPTCSSLDESQCATSESCAGLYRGNDCSCDPIDGCSCTSYTYEGCGDL